MNDKDTTTERIKALLDERHAAGLAKYGVTVDREDLTPEQWCQHAIEEALDGVAYLMRLKDTLGQVGSMNDGVGRVAEAEAGTCKHEPRRLIDGLERVCKRCRVVLDPVRCPACVGWSVVVSGNDTRACPECNGTGVARWETAP